MLHFIHFYTIFTCRMFSSDSGGRIRFRDGGRRLVVSNISSQDNGVYSCRAKNLVDVVESSDNLMVNLLSKYFNVDLFPSFSFSFTCLVFIGYCMCIRLVQCITCRKCKHWWIFWEFIFMLTALLSINHKYVIHFL